MMTNLDVTLGLIVAGTLVSEDLTCLTTGLLIYRGDMSWLLGVAACFVGIYVGDLGLWLLGRAGSGTLCRLPGLNRQLPEAHLIRFGAWFDRNAPLVIFASRFMPGTRLPLYVAAGALGRKGWRFAFWSLIAAALWTPAVVLLTGYFGPRAVAPIKWIHADGWWAPAIGGIAGWLVLWLIKLAAYPLSRAHLAARFARLWRWEFWPSWLIYLPLVPWIAALAVRYRGLLTITAANPGMSHGGFAGESKFQILQQLPSTWTMPSRLIPVTPLEEGPAVLDDLLASTGWSLPLVFKPDAGERGRGVRLIRSRANAIHYLSETAAPVLVQMYHPGPFEAGIFYYRFPNESSGHIFSITDKQFPTLTGDGTHTLEQLIWRHPRYRMQGEMFCTRHADKLDRVLAADETLPLAMAGNHCQGTMFCDGSHLLSPTLERTIDSIARGFDGFFFGRFDIRYSSPIDLRAGRNFAIIELNGITSESTNVYDPGRSLWWVYRTMYRQWMILFKIANINRCQGHYSSSFAALWHTWQKHLRERPRLALAD